MPPGSNGSAVVFFVRRYQLRRQERFPLPTKFVKYDGKGTSRYAVMASAVNPTVLP